MGESRLAESVSISSPPSPKPKAEVGPPARPAQCVAKIEGQSYTCVRSAASARQAMAAITMHRVPSRWVELGRLRQAAR